MFMIVVILIPSLVLGNHLWVDCNHPQNADLLQFQTLQNAIDQSKDGDTITVLPGIYSAECRNFYEDLGGNTQEHRAQVHATAGYIIQGKAIHLVGEYPDSVILQTNAGYGVLFLNSRGSSIENVTLTCGKRDQDGNATDAGIVVKTSSVRIHAVTIRDNADRRDSVVVGIGGIVGRENSELFIDHCRIINNGWDGIGLYRGAYAYISDNLIQKGRGAGIGITWDAVAVVVRNQISEYWKGIGTFGSSRAIVTNNLVGNCLGWGIIATGESYLDAINNNIIHNGNCGLAIWSDECHGRLVNNNVIYNGWKDEWVAPQVGLWNGGKAEHFRISNNDVWGNVKGNYRGMDDLTGKDGNISSDPAFIGEPDYHLQTASPCINSGAGDLSESDGSISDMGMFGGPGAQ
jgi:hypothetical protein